MNTSVTYTTSPLNDWNIDRSGEHRMDDLAAAFLRDCAITDRDRIAFARRELRKLGYDVEAEPVDWTKPKMICSFEDSRWGAFGFPATSGLHRRLAAIAERCGIRGSVYDEDQTFSRLAAELYGEDALFDEDEYSFLEDEYYFSFKGDPVLVEAVFQAVGVATKLELATPDDGSEPHHVIVVAPPTMVMGK
jgi:hypothetical protein